ncbi:unnamed protein product, partial [Rotaria sp. Silwood1]
EKLNSPWGIYVDNTSGIYIVDQGNHRVQYWPSGASVATTVAGTTGSVGPWSYQFSSPTSIMLDPYGYIYVLDTGNARVQKWFPGDPYGITILSATMSSPMGMSLDFSGNLFIADTSYHRVLSFPLSCPSPTTTTTQPPTISQSQICSTGIWNQTFTVTAGITSSLGATTTLLNYPADIGFDGFSNMYVADRANHRIQLFRSGQTVGTTVAGTTGTAGGTYAQLSSPYGITVTQNGTMFIMDTNNYRVLRWQLGDPMGYIVAGGNGAGGAFTQIGTSYCLFVDNQYNVYISENSNHRVTVWYNQNKTAGALVAGGNGLGSSAERLNYPWGLYVDSNQTVYIADASNHRVQRWLSGSSTGTTVAGTTSSAGSWSYQLNTPTAVTLDPYGFIYVLDYGNSRVQKWFPGDSYGKTVISVTMGSPLGMEIDLSANIVIADTNSHRILSFALLCPGTTTTTSPPPTVTTIPLCSTATWNSTSTLAAGSTNTIGSTATLLNYPYDIA